MKNFWQHLPKRRSIEYCWEWRGYLNSDGYGVVHTKGKKYLAHRVSYTLHRGHIPEGQLVCHGCDNRRCCNPAHLFLGSHKDNMVDAARKGRLPGALLTKRAREIIRTENLSIRLLAKRYRVSEELIRRVRAG